MDKSMIISEIQKLSIDEQIDLVQDIWDGIAAQAEQVPLTRRQKRLIDKSLREYEKNPAAATHWEEVMERLRRRKR
jgi:putative addiction module component (TIGR02574 family)